MAATQPIRHRRFELVHTLAVLVAALFLVVAALAAGAVLSMIPTSRTTDVATAPSPGPITSPSALPTVAPTEPPTAAPTTTPALDLLPAGVPPVDPGTLPSPHGKVILVVLSEQKLTAYQDGRVVLTSVVATGRPELSTPRGTFHVMAKYSPLKFTSPWPKGNPYWYPDEWVSYGMLFANDGFFLHDAPWRTIWGPGVNQGSSGTHGCVNVPKAAMASLYQWAAVGTTVVIE